MSTEKNKNKQFHKMVKKDRKNGQALITLTSIALLYIAITYQNILIKTPTVKQNNPKRKAHKSTKNRSFYKRKTDRFLAITTNRQGLTPENGPFQSNERRILTSINQTTPTIINKPIHRKYRNHDLTDFYTERYTLKQSKQKWWTYQYLEMYQYEFNLYKWLIRILDSQVIIQNTKEKKYRKNDTYGEKIDRRILTAKFNLINVLLNDKLKNAKRYALESRKILNNEVNHTQYIILHRKYLQVEENPTLTTHHFIKTNRFHTNRHINDQNNTTSAIQVTLFDGNSIQLKQDYPASVFSLIHIKKITKCWSPYIMIQIINLIRNIIFQPIKQPLNIKNILNDIISYNAEQSIIIEEHEQLFMLNLLSMEELSRTLQIRDNHHDELHNNCLKRRKRRGVILRYANLVLSIKIRNHGSHLSSLIMSTQNLITNAHEHDRLILPQVMLNLKILSDISCHLCQKTTTFQRLHNGISHIPIEPTDIVRELPSQQIVKKHNARRKYNRNLPLIYDELQRKSRKKDQCSTHMIKYKEPRRYQTDEIYIKSVRISHQLKYLHALCESIIIPANNIGNEILVPRKQEGKVGVIGRNILLQKFKQRDKNNRLSTYLSMENMHIMTSIHMPEKQIIKNVTNKMTRIILLYLEIAWSQCKEKIKMEKQCTENYERRTFIKKKSHRFIKEAIQNILNGYDKENMMKPKIYSVRINHEGWQCYDVYIQRKNKASQIHEKFESQQSKFSIAHAYHHNLMSCHLIIRFRHPYYKLSQVPLSTYELIMFTIQNLSKFYHIQSQINMKRIRYCISIMRNSYVYKHEQECNGYKSKWKFPSKTLLLRVKNESESHNSNKNLTNMRSTRSKNRTRKSKSPSPKVSNNASSIRTSKKVEATKAKKITPSKTQKRPTVEDMLKNAPFPTSEELLQRDDAAIAKAEKKLKKLQEENACESDILDAKLELQDAVDDKNATITSIRITEEETDNVSFDDFDTMFKSPPVFPSPDTSSNSTDTSTSSPRVTNVTSKPDSGSIIDHIEVITQTTHTDNEDQNDSVATEETPQCNNTKQQVATTTLPTVPPQRSLLQTTIDDAVQVMDPQQKVQMMVQKARARAQAQAKKLKAMEAEQKKQAETNLADQKKVKSSQNASKSQKDKKEMNAATKGKSTRSKESVKSHNRYSALDDDETSKDDDNSVQDATSEESVYQDDESAMDQSKQTGKSNDDSESPKLVQKSLRATKRMNVTFLTLKLKVKKHRDPVKELINKSRAWLKAVQMIDPTFVVYEYRAKEPDTAIVSSKKVPDEIEAFKKFFSGANPQPSTGHAWCQLWVGHDEPITNIKASLQGWSSDQDTYVYIKRLQHKETVRDYFLLWSTPKMDTEALHSATVAAIKKYTNQTLHFAYVWAIIRRNKGQYKLNESKSDRGQQYIRALHIEVPRDMKDITYSILGKLFSSASPTRLLYRDLRMVPVLRKELTSYVKMKVNHLIAKQEKYLSTLSVAELYNLDDIDYVNSSLKMSMREMIMSLKTLRTFDKNNQSMPVFTSIDAITWPEAGYALTYPTYLEDEAQEYIASLPSFLLWCYGDQVMDMLTPAAARQAHAAPWDPEEMRSITPQSMELDAITAEADNVAPWMDNEVPSIHIPNINKVTENFLFQRSTDADSISTFNTKKSNRSDADDLDDGTRTSKRAKKAQKLMNGNSKTGDSSNPAIATSREGSSGNVNSPPGHRDDDLGAVL